MRHQLPNNIDAEQGLLGALLIDNNVLFMVDDFLRPEHFYDPVHQRIYETAMGLIVKGELASPVTMKSYMILDEGLEQLGGAIYLARLASGATTIANSREYGRTVYDMWVRREGIKLGEDMIVELSEASIEHNPSETMHKITDRIFDITSETRQQPTMTAHQAAVKYLDDIADGNEGLKWGVSDIDRWLQFEDGELYIIAAPPSHGKTAVMVDMAATFASEGHKVLFASLEMPVERVMARVTGSIANVQYAHIPKYMRKGGAEADKIRSASDNLGGVADNLILHGGGRLGLGDIGRLIRRHSPKVVFVDYLQIMKTPDSARKDSISDRIAALTGGLKALAMQHGIPIIVGCQLTKEGRRGNEKPNLDGLYGSSAIENDATGILLLYYEYKVASPDTREIIEHELEVNIAKSRNGPTGRFKIFCDMKKNRFNALEERVDDAYSDLWNGG